MPTSITERSAKSHPKPDEFAALRPQPTLRDCRMERNGKRETSEKHKKCPYTQLLETKRQVK